MAHTHRNIYKGLILIFRMEIYVLKSQIEEMIKSLAKLIEGSSFGSNPNKLIIHHSSNSIKNLNNLLIKLDKFNKE